MVDDALLEELSEEETSRLSARISTGVPGLDEVLLGGLVPGRSYLVRGGPGQGKTTLGLHFLTAGARADEKVLYISMGESESQLRGNARALGFNVRGVTFLDLSPSVEFFSQVETYDIFSPADVEREPTTRKILDAVESLRPKRVFVDSMTQFRYLSPDEFQYRKQALSFMRFLVDKGATVVFTSESSPQVPDDDLQFLSDGVIELHSAPEGRTVMVTKFRGSGFRGGPHSVRLGSGGMEIFPRLVPTRERRDFVSRPSPSGVPELDELLNGGIDRGTITIISGPSGVGKTTLGLQFMKEAAGRGERSVVYLFEESEETLMSRCEAINIPVREMMEKGTLGLTQVEPLRYSPDEFASLVRHEVEEKGAKIVMLDSTAGYGVSMQGRDLARNLHALSMYLKSWGVTLFLIEEVGTITGEFRASENNVSYMADNIVFLRHLEIDGEIRKAIGVLKKRTSDFQKSLREIEITRYGLKVGRPLTGLRGILGGTPELNRSPSSEE